MSYRPAEAVVLAWGQALSPRWRFLRTFAPWQFIKWAYTAFVLDYSAAAFLVRLPLHLSSVRV